MLKGSNKIIIILGIIIFLLLCVVGYGFYTGLKIKSEILLLKEERDNFHNELNKVSEDKEDLNKKYELLLNDVAEIYKTCMTEDACRGRYPLVSWYCNNVGDEVPDPSHVCVCDNSCKLSISQINV